MSVILYHVSKIKNHDSIMKNGLLIGKESSNYGEMPKHKAIYLYHEKNIDVLCDFIELFKEADIYKVLIEDTSKLIPDEDSGASDWETSLEIMGTCAYTDNIPPKNISYIGTVDEENYSK